MEQLALYAKNAQITHYPRRRRRFLPSRKDQKNDLKTQILFENAIQKQRRQKSSQKPGLSIFFEGPKRLKTSHFEVEIGLSTSEGRFLRV